MQRAVGKTNLTSSNQTCDQDLANSQLAVLRYTTYYLKLIIWSTVQFNLIFLAKKKEKALMCVSRVRC